MINTQYINLNMVPSGVLPILYISQYDIGRPLGMVVYNGGEAVDLDTYTVTIEATRTDGTPITAAVTTDGNIGAFVTTATMTNKADKYLAKLVIFDSQSNRVASLAFVMCVTPKTMDENAESIEEDKSLYQQYTGTVQTLIADIREDIEEINDQLNGDPYQMVYIKGDASGLAWQKMCVTPEMFGAVGDGTHDDTTALQAAVNYGFSNKLAVYLTKKYLITSPLVIKGTNATVTGKGSVLLGNGSARIIAGATLTHVIETAPGADDIRAYGITVKDITIDGVDQATDGFYSGYAFAGCVLENVIIRRCTIGLHINGNCYLNSFNAIRTSYCTNYGIYFENGNNTSNVFNKCYVESSVNAYRINGQYCSMISCCADNITGTVFNLLSFNGTLVGCGSEAKNFTCMFDVSNNSKVNVIGGMFWGNPNLAEYYFRVGSTAYLGIKGCRINYTTSNMQSGALCYIGGTSELNLEKVSIYKGFPGENYISGTGSLHNNTAIYTKALEVTLDENNEVDIGLNPQYSSLLSVYVTGRTGWVAIPYNYNNVTTKVRICTRSDWFPTISNKEFTITIRYIRNSQI